MRCDAVSVRSHVPVEQVSGGWADGSLRRIRHAPCPGQRPPIQGQPGEEQRMAMQVRSSGCLYSIIASVVLTIVLNLVLRGCSGY
jgi:hypothetical protein